MWDYCVGYCFASVAGRSAVVVVAVVAVGSSFEGSVETAAAAVVALRGSTESCRAVASI